MRTTHRPSPSSAGTQSLWAHRGRRDRIGEPDRALSLAMCRGLRADWDLDAAAARIAALGVGHRALEQALEAARELDRHAPTIASSRAASSLARALTGPV